MLSNFAHLKVMMGSYTGVTKGAVVEVARDSVMV
jgi:hypothetical protein